MSALKISLLLASLPFLALGAQRRSTPSSFQLYAYGPGLGGLPMFNADGYAYVGNPNLSNSTDAAQVTFSPGSDNMWIGAPNTTASGNETAPSWSNVTMFIPGPGSSDGRVGFQSSDNSTDDSRITSGFTFYGSTAMVVQDGTLETLWYGLPVGDSGIHALYWNTTSDNQIPIVLRNIAPSNPSDRT